ncbi:MAG TPA: thioredoxin domain-containing protein [Methanocella sp.]|nr:thioredoxin domain-containing protein [Methanocella sp.]
MTAIRVISVLAVLAIVVAMFACGIVVAQNAAPMMNPPVSMTAGTPGKVTMADVDSALASGPVLVEFESQECTYCKQQKPISEALIKDYGGKVTMIPVDVAQSRDLANMFQVRGVPQMDVIVKKSGDKYTYVGKDGATSDSIAGSRFIGLTQSNDLKTAIDAALRMRGQ